MRRFVIKLKLLYAHITVTRSKTWTSERSPIFALFKLKTILPDVCNFRWIFSKKRQRSSEFLRWLPTCGDVVTCSTKRDGRPQCCTSKDDNNDNSQLLLLLLLLSFIGNWCGIRGQNDFGRVSRCVSPLKSEPERLCSSASKRYTNLNY